MNIAGSGTARAFSTEQLKHLDICHHIHKQAEELYLTLSEQHCDHRAVARLWGELAIDKCNHADAYKMTGRLKSSVLRDIKGEPEAAVKFLEKMKHAVKSIKHSTLDVAGALGVAIKMEEGLKKFHILHVAIFNRDQDRKLLTSTLKNDRDIIQVITEHHVNMTLIE